MLKIKSNNVDISNDKDVRIIYAESLEGLSV